MCLLVVLFVPTYLAAVWVSTLLCRDTARRRAYRVAAGVAAGMSAVVALIGVPYTRDSTRMPALYAAIALLALAPLVLPRLPRRARLGALAAVIGLFALPVVHVEYLTLRHGEELQEVYDAKAGQDSSDQVLFSVFDYSPGHATVLRVENPKSTMGYFLRFRREHGAWDVDTSPQAVLWSDGGSAHVGCPYPTSALLLLHGVWAVKC